MGIFYQMGTNRYSCTIDQAPAFNTVYACKTESADALCIDNDFIQISNTGDDGLAICAIVFDGKAIPINNHWFKRDGGVYKRRYDVNNGVAIMSVPNDGILCGGEITSKYWIVSGNDEHGRYGKLESQCTAVSTRNSNQNVGKGTGIGYHCCSMDGSEANRAGCQRGGAYTYDEALAKCEADDKRLCTREEVLANKGTGTGCSFDGVLVWTSTPCTESRRLLSDVEMSEEANDGKNDESLGGLRILIVGSIIATMICIVAIVFFAAIKCAKSQPKIRIYDDEQNENENENERVMEI